MAVDDARLPEGVEQGAVGGPTYKTTVLPAASGDEQRVVEWDVARGEWDIGYGIRNKTDLLAVIAFFRAVMGRAYSFRFKDWSDFEATNESFGTGNGTTTIFQLHKTYASLDLSAVVERSIVRSIYLPVPSTLVIKDNGSTVSSYTVLAGGRIQFNTAPLNTHALTWTGEFDVAARFDVDKLNVSMTMADLGTVRGIRVIEVLDSVA
jgi:uncharacterized protein (TIGR02217 family)